MTSYTRERELFLQHLGESANVTASALVATISRKTAYEWRKVDSEFAEAWDDAMAMATDTLEAEGRRRAMEGVEELYVSQGRVVTDKEGNPLVKRVYSDGLMTLLLKAHRPERFKDRVSADLTGTINMTVTRDDADL